MQIQQLNQQIADANKEKEIILQKLKDILKNKVSNLQASPLWIKGIGILFSHEKKKNETIEPVNQLDQIQSIIYDHEGQLYKQALQSLRSKYVILSKQFDELFQERNTLKEETKKLVTIINQSQKVIQQQNEHIETFKIKQAEMQEKINNLTYSTNLLDKLDISSSITDENLLNLETIFSNLLNQINLEKQNRGLSQSTDFILFDHKRSNYSTIRKDLFNSKLSQGVDDFTPYASIQKEISKILDEVQVKDQQIELIETNNGSIKILPQENILSNIQNFQQLLKTQLTQQNKRPKKSSGSVSKLNILKRRLKSSSFSPSKQYFRSSKQKLNSVHTNKENESTENRNQFKMKSLNQYLVDLSIQNADEFGDQIHFSKFNEEEFQQTIQIKPEIQFDQYSQFLN